MVSESSPLLQDQESLSDRSTVADLQSRFTLESRVIKNFIKKRFWWLCILGVAAIITLQLSFLPRTSPNRDFRRWHNLRFTRSDVKRVFLVQSELGVPDSDGNTVEQNLHNWLAQLSDATAKSPAALASTSPSGGSALAALVEQSMRSLGYLPYCPSYEVSPELQAPESSSLELLDVKTSRLLYTAHLIEPGSPTPAYFLFSENGTVNASYVYANKGSPQDFALLAKHSVSIKDRIVILAHSLQSEYSLSDKIELAEAEGCAAVLVYADTDSKWAISRVFKPLSPPKRKLRLPISYQDIEPILQTLGSPPAEFPGWSFAPVTTDRSLELSLSCKFSPARLNATNIIAEIEGVLNDSEILIGASRDVLTASNPSSGHAIMLETMRRLSHLRKLGWRPLRTIRFVSWDASRSGALGSLAGLSDADVFHRNLPILAYIDLDGDVVTGSHFTVDSNPLFNHILQSTAHLIPFPANSTYYRRLSKDRKEGTETEKQENVLTFLRDLLSEPPQQQNTVNANNNQEHDDKDDDDKEDSEVSLYHYWHKQDKNQINNKLGHVMAGKNSGTFQFSYDTPTVSLKFSPSPEFNDSLYIPESSKYSMKWVENDADPYLDLHASLVRFIGLFVLSMSEHEVVDTRTSVYFSQLQEQLEEVMKDNYDVSVSWSNKTVEWDLLKKSLIYRDLQDASRYKGSEVKFGHIWKQLRALVAEVVEQSKVFDEYNREVENLWTTDYPWYKSVKKIHIFAKFKVTNYKLLRLEKELNQLVEWAEVPTSKEETEKGYHHFIYDVPRGVKKLEEKQIRGAFGAFYEAFDSSSMDQVVRLAVAKYERLKAVYKRIT